MNQIRKQESGIFLLPFKFVREARTQFRLYAINGRQLKCVANLNPKIPKNLNDNNRQ